MANRFQGKELIGRVPEELQTEVHDIVQEAVKKRREAKGKGEQERYTHLNAEFQRISRRDKKTFLSDQCKEIEDKNKMGKTIEISSRKLEIPRELSMQIWHNKGQKWYRFNRSRRY